MSRTNSLDDLAVIYLIIKNVMLDQVDYVNMFFVAIVHILAVQKCFINLLLLVCVGYRVLSHATRLQASLGAACHSEMTHRYKVRITTH